MGIIFGGCLGRLFAEVLVAAKLLDASAPGIVGMYALMGAGEGGRARPGAIAGGVQGFMGWGRAGV